MPANTFRIEVSTYGGPFRPIAEPFLVPTPLPYVIDLAVFGGAEDKARGQDQIIESCQKLYDILTTLGIPLKAAREADYTLNLDTRDRLTSIALAQDNNAALKGIRAHEW